MPLYKYLLTGLLMMGASQQLFAQETTADKLSIPQTSAFKLVDVSPTLIESPATPKAFGISVLQSFAGDGWPQNYTAQFTPYWWALPKKRDVFRFIGVKRDTSRPAAAWKMQPFSALQFTNISVAFIRKDMIPDTSGLSQKVFSIGFHSTLVRAYRSSYATRLHALVDTLTQKQQADILDAVSSDPAYDAAVTSGDTATIARILRQYTTRKNEALTALMTRVKNQLTEKPLFQWDIAGAYATYGIADTTWKTGRVGVWTTLSLNTPLNFDAAVPNTNYLSIAAYGRYMYDAYALEKGMVTGSNSFDLGGRLSFEFDPVSFGVEAVYRRYAVDEHLKSQRVVGYANYRIAKNIYINGAFGNDFGLDKSRILAIFGITLGFGNEKLDLGQLPPLP
ncbi:hypothetical protein [Chitinophaga eiseniae]|uniref:DUF3078 domain-containing protein n=1 Tax=Chitinophaga eiseniae TaxID=634771 RepID=A0A847SMF4_9BACT|nr:hypothetical protein [Chitinophaga eiseniae]NLR80405.1 hypothetical protein [Chitinophaga eiseniae]